MVIITLTPHLATLTPLCRWVQEKFAIPAGRLTEGTLERGHQLVMQCKKSFSRCGRYSELHGVFFYWYLLFVTFLDFTNISFS